MLLLSVDLKGPHTYSLARKQHKMMGWRWGWRWRLGRVGASGPHLKLESIGSALELCRLCEQKEEEAGVRVKVLVCVCTRRKGARIVCFGAADRG